MLTVIRWFPKLNNCKMYHYLRDIDVCNPECDNGGICSAPNTCDCEGTGYSDDLCQTGEFSLFILYIITQTQKH